jgi:ABC-2 type transport system permease protein
MDKMLAVFKREYLQAVRKKMFIVMTLLFPLFLGAVFIIPAMVMTRGLGQKRVAVIDGSGALRDAFEKPDDEIARQMTKRVGTEQPPNLMYIEYVDAHARADLNTAAKPYLTRLTAGEGAVKLDAILIVPAAALESNDATLKFYSRSATDFITEQRLASTASRGIHRYRLAKRGIDAAEAEKLLASAHIEAVQLSKTGEAKSGGEVNFIAGIMLAGLLVVPSFVYGLEIMRGIIQEKTDRVVEVLISSMSPTELLTGKILGIAAVGLTQVSVWLIVAGGAGLFFASVAAAAGAGDILRFLHPATFIYFLIFFVLAYLTYVCVYAIAGAACNSDKEAQQLIAPISMLMMLPWFLVLPLMTNPDSSLAVGLSLAPVFGPMTMFLRTLVADPPLWHIALSIAVSIATIALFFRVTSKIFRVGVLSYGKRPTLPELWRWLKVA